MNELIQELAHGIGYAMIWGLGLIGVPILTAIAAIIFFHIKSDTVSWIWGITLFLYLLGSGVFLITL